MDAERQKPSEGIGRNRKQLMEAFSKASAAELKAFVDEACGAIKADPVRGPETGLVMVRGRIGGGGSPFNLGEVSMSRASIRLASGEIGHGQVLGTDRDHARLAAILDALGQMPDMAGQVDALAARIEARIAAADSSQQAQVAATKVDFFTLVRGED